ncbi:caspase domain-containing protein [Xylaria cf. heliscus]|nr:caspase domain-containing protein [Xylaria cf. heliscus]
MLSQSGQRKWALLIGIDHYSSNYVRDLSGCLKDVDLMESYLRKSVGISNITKFQSPAISDIQASPSYSLPTYKNVVGALENLAAQAQKDDFVYIHFSGHGTRLPTKFPPPSHTSQDECLVLVREDLSKNNGKVDHLRDVEFAYLLKKIADKGATITIVMDCCHSGGACRDIQSSHNYEPSVPRGVDFLPEEALVVRSPIRQLSVLEPFRSNHTNAVRGASVVPHWLTSSGGIEFLAACRANQKAQEVCLGDRKYRGLLTECLLCVLQDHPTGLLTCEMIYNLVSRKVASHPKLTHPQDIVFGGERRRVFFGTDRPTPKNTIVIGASHLSDNKLQIKLSVGKAHGVTKADLYAIYPPGRKFTNIMDYNDPSVICRILQVENFSSTAVAEQGVANVSINWNAIRQGEILRKHVLERRTAKLLLHHQKDFQSMEVLENRMHESALVNLDNSNPFFTVHLHGSGRFKISFTSNGGLCGSEAEVNVQSEETLLSTLRHLGIYYNLLDLATPPGYNDDLSVEKLGYLPRHVEVPSPRRCDPKAPPVGGLESLEISDPQDIYEKDIIAIRVRNKSTSGKTMFIEILDLDPSWEATRVYPIKDNCPTELPPGEATDFFLRMLMPTSVENTQQPKFDSIIVLATTNHQENFPEAILPPLSDPLQLHSSPLKENEHTRKAQGADSMHWYAQRVNVRVLER